jgi:hypothetical protein
MSRFDAHDPRDTDHGDHSPGDRPEPSSRQPPRARSQLLSPVATTTSAGDGQQGVAHHLAAPDCCRWPIGGREEHISAEAPAGA